MEGFTPAVSDEDLTRFAVSEVPSPLSRSSSYGANMSTMRTLAEAAQKLGDDLKRRKIAILTSGGDAPGMNAAVRAAATVCMVQGHAVFAVRNGYKGLVSGGGYIQELTEKEVHNISQRGGTNIGSARCKEFRTREGRVKAARNLLLNGISNLIVIGGDGSLTGANLFKQEWASLLDEIEAADVDERVKLEHQHLNLIGIVGSIDNDLIGFSMTVGADTAMHRIIQAIDALVTTAQSHERTFVVEVMGRNCGYLALMTAIACGADWVFIPERPPDVEDWEKQMCDALRRRRANNYSLVIVAEGATDRVRRPIDVNYIKQILSERLSHDTRITRLGHVQRGGAPSAFDRVLGSRCGAEAALTLLSQERGDRARIVGVRWNQMISLDLEEAVSRTRQVNEALENRQFTEAIRLRGAVFRRYFHLYMHSRSVHPTACESPKRVGILHIGAPAPAMNICVKICARVAASKGHTPIGIHDGLRGLVRGDLEVLTRQQVSGWARAGGAFLGTNRTIPLPKSEVTVEAIAAQIEANKLDSLVFIGGFEAYASMLRLVDARERLPALRLPMVLVPSTISNNVPGTDFSIGSDTALNGVVDAVDRLKQSAESSRRRVFLVETKGGFSGYLATIGALAGGADDVFIHEEGVRLSDLGDSITHLRHKFARHFHQGLIVRNEFCSRRYTTDFMQAAFEEEGSYAEKEFPSFTVRHNVLGHLLEGGAPTPLDRVRGAVLAYNAIDHVLAYSTAPATKAAASPTNAENACVVGIGVDFMCNTVAELKPEVDFKHRRPKQHWHERLVPLVRMLEMNSQRPFQYESETVTLATRKGSADASSSGTASKSPSYSSLATIAIREEAESAATSPVRPTATAAAKATPSTTFSALSGAYTSSVYTSPSPTFSASTSASKSAATTSRALTSSYSSTVSTSTAGSAYKSAGAAAGAAAATTPPKSLRFSLGAPSPKLP